MDQEKMTVLRTIGRRASRFTGVDWSPDGKTIAAGGADGCLWLFSAGGGDVKVIDAHPSEVFGVTLSPDGTRIASTAADGSLRVSPVWDLVPSFYVKGHDLQTFGVCWSPDGEMLATGSFDKSAKVWDARSGALLNTIDGFGGFVMDVSWSPDGKLLACAVYDGSIHIYDTTTQSRLDTFACDDATVWGVAWSPDGRRLAGTCGSGVIAWTWPTGNRWSALLGHEKTVYRVAWSLNGRYLATTSEDNMVRIWEPENTKATHTFRDHAAEPFGVAWMPDSHRVASGSADATVRIWNVETGIAESVLRGFEAEPTTISWSRDRARLCVAGESTRVIDSGTAAIVREFDGRNGALSGSGKSVAVVVSDAEVRIRNIETGTTRSAVKHSGGRIYDCAWSLDNRLLALRCDKGIVVSNFRATKLIPESFSRACGISGNLVAISGHSDLLVWDWQKRSEVWKRLSGTAVALAWSHDGSLLASGCDDGKVRIWNSTGFVTGEFEGHTKRVRFLDWSSDGKTLASMSEDCEVRVWRLKDGALLGTAPALPYRNKACGVSFGSYVPPVREYLDGAVRIEVVPYGEAAAVAQSICAKVILIGESNAGKTSLVRRFMTGKHEEPPSTHGMQTFLLDPSQLDGEAEAPSDEQREVVFWDFGGQRHYQLIHQAFLHDTTLAVMLFDSTRDQPSFDAVREWNDRLITRARGRSVSRLLVRSKADLGGAVNQPELERLRQDLGAAPYLEVSSSNGAGIRELGRKINELIDWPNQTRVSRTESFQRVHQLIDDLRKQGRIIRYERDLLRELGPGVEHREFDAVVKQLAGQGRVADVRLSATNERVVVLRIDVVEKYAGSLVLKARNLLRGVPVVDERTIGTMTEFPGMEESERISRDEERVVLDAVIDLLVHEGLCLRHAGLLVFPSEFPRDTTPDLDQLPHRKPIYYDFTGPIDNIYAPLVANLAVSGQFGSVRLWRNRAEYEETGRGVFGVYLRELRRGCGHLDLYFSDGAEPGRRDLFVAYVDSHLREHGVTIVERLGMTCVCGEELFEKWFRKALERGEAQLKCPNCSVAYPVLAPASDAREKPETLEKLRVLKVEVERAKAVAAEASKNAVERARAAGPREGLRLLHLSDLHLDGTRNKWTLMQPLLADLRQMKADRVDYLVVSGDFADRHSLQGFDIAEEFLKDLLRELQLTADRLILAPGNHDLDQGLDVYGFEMKKPNRLPEEFMEVATGAMKGYLVRKDEEYPKRFERFRKFHHNLLQREYPLRHEEQGVITWYPETGIEFLTLNTAWKIDKAFPDRAAIHGEALNRALMESRKHDARLRIVVWHHAVWANRQIANPEQIEHLVKAGFRLCLHGDIHEETAQVVPQLGREKRLQVLGAGSFGSRREGLPDGTPRLYSLLEIDEEFTRVRVRMRSQRRADGAFDTFAIFGDDAESRRGWFDVRLVG